MTVTTVDIQKRATKGTSIWKLAMRSFIKNRLAMTSLVIFLLVILVCVIGPFFVGHDPNSVNLKGVLQRPSAEHWLGTDKAGRDVLSRLLVGGRYSLMIGILSEVVSIALGTLFGVLAGFYRKLDGLIMRICDILLCLPYLVILIVLAAIMSDIKVPSETRIYYIMFIIGALNWPGLARLVRGEILSIREQEYSLAAEALGIRDSRRMFRHILPNTLAPIIVTATLGIGGAILSESTLSFIGLGVPPPNPSWGNMVQDARESANLATRMYLWMPAGIMLLITVVSINLVGDGLRDALDPKLKH